MHFLRLLGTLRLEGDDGPVTGRAAQARRRAVLAVLAVAPDRTVSRDKLVGLVWPETSESKARHLLSTALYDLRQELGADALVSHGDHEIRLSRDHVATDLDAFLEAREREDAEAALVAYQGDFLDGFYLRDAQDFERWADGRRRELRRDLASLLETDAAAADGRDPGRAARLWAARAALDPSDTEMAVRAVDALAAAGEAAAAQRVVERYHAARSELELEADPRVGERADAARARLPEPGAPAAPAGAAPSTLPPAAHRTRRLGPAAALAGVLAVLAVILVAGGPSDSSPAGDLEDGPGVRVAVLPFSVQDPSSSWLSRAAAELLAVRLQVPDAVIATDPFTVITLAEGGPRDSRTPATARDLTRRVGGTHFVLGSVRGEGGALHLTAGLYTAAGDHVGAVTAEAPGDAVLAEAMDSLALRLLAGPLEKGRPVAWAEGTMTASLPALRAYVAGMEAFRSGDYNSAVRYLRQAVVEDSLFALAHLRLGIAAEWAGRLAVTGSALERAHELRVRLTERDQLLLDGKRDATTGDGRRAVARYRAMVARDPGDVEALYEVGDVYFHNPRWGVSARETASWFRRALAIDSTHTAATQHLARLLAAEQDPAALSRLIDAALAQGVRGLAATELRTFGALMAGDPEALAHEAEALRVLSDDRLLAFVLNALRHSQRPAAGEPLVRVLTESDRAPDVRAVGEILLGFADAAAGRHGAARSHLVAARALDVQQGVLAQALLLGTTDFPAGPDEVRALLADLSALPAPPDEPGALSVRAPTFNTESHRLLLRGRLHLRLGQPDQAAATIARLETGGSHGDARLLEAELAFAEGDHARALERIGAEPDSLLVVSDPAGYVEYLRGRILEANGRGEEAVRWYLAMRHEADFGVLFDERMRAAALGLR